MTERASRDITRGPLAAVIRFCLDNKLIVLLVCSGLLLWGALTAPFNWDMAGLPRSPVPVDAIPDIGENQQIVFTEWPGRSPQDIDDQITYPLTVALLGLPGVKEVRSESVFGFSMVYVIFDDSVEFYWSRSRILEKLNSLPAGTLPEGATPALGPDATGLGQIFWYTLEGRDERGEPAGGWDLDELRSIQDFIVRYQLASAQGVAEVASVGGFVREYQIDVNPDAMRAAGVTLAQVVGAVRDSNLDIGARTLEINKAEHLVRGLGFVRSIEDLELIAVASRDDAPILLRDIAAIGTGPALRRGAMDKGGAEAVGGVVVARYGENPMRVIENVKQRIEEISPGLPSKTLDDGTLSKVTIVPFYDRSGLIRETLGTLYDAISQQVLVTIAVVVLLLVHLRSSLLISATLPSAVLLTFIGMKLLGVDANVVALAGIAIAVGSIVDMGIVMCENIVRRLGEASPDEPAADVIHRASCEVGGAVLTAALTTVVSFLPVFALEASEGKLFKPLAWTKTLALLASIGITLAIIPPAAHALFVRRVRRMWVRIALAGAVIAAAVAVGVRFDPIAGLALGAVGAFVLMRPLFPHRLGRSVELLASVAAVAVVLIALSSAWAPLGAGAGAWRNLLFIALTLGAIIALFWLIRLAYRPLLAWCLRHKAVSTAPSVIVVLLGLTAWLGFDRVWGWLPDSVRQRQRVVDIAHAMPGFGKEFMPSLDEGSFLFMPTTMPHASIGEAMDILAALDLAIESIPEVDEAVGKIGRADSPLDPAPVSMIETVINYKSEYITDNDGRRLTFRIDPDTGDFARDDRGELIPDRRGRPYRQWRDHIQSPRDIWDEIVAATELPGVTSAPRLQPIETRIIMLQSGIRAPIAVKVYGPDLATIDDFALEIERLLKQVPTIEASTVFADRVEGKPYLEIEIDRERIARYGISIADVQQVIEVAIGGKPLTMTVEGRERYPVRVRYQRELRDDLDTLGMILIPTPDGRQIPLQELAEFTHRRGPQMIRSEDTFLVAYVPFDKAAGVAEVTAVDDARRFINAKIESGELDVPAGVRFRFAGQYENQVRAAERLTLVVPVALAVIFLLLYLQFRSVGASLLVFSAVFIAWGGGFLMMWLFGRDWFMDVAALGVNLRELFQMKPMNLSVAVWVGFLALFGIATDDGVVMTTRLKQTFQERRPETVEAIRAATVEGAALRVRAALMTSATTILALMPVLTATGRGSDVMAPIATPIFGGMMAALLSLFTVPVLYCAAQEWRRRVGVGAE